MCRFANLIVGPLKLVSSGSVIPFPPTVGPGKCDDSLFETDFVGLASKNVNQNEIKKDKKHNEQHRGYFIVILSNLLVYKTSFSTRFSNPLFI